MTKLSGLTFAACILTLTSLSEAGWAATPTEKVLYAFQGGTDGACSEGSLTFDVSGNLYGTTASGGTWNDGTGFELTRTSSGWSETVLYSFQGGADGKSPDSTLVIDEAGNFYGTTSAGGTGSCINGCGTVFQLTPPAVDGGPWTESIIYSFQGGSDGAYPNPNGVISDTFGNLYGTTQEGGRLDCPDNNAGTGCGTVFELSFLAGIWTKTALYSFQGGKQDGALPSAGLTIDGTGNLYGTTGYGGAKNLGTLYQVYSSNGNWSEKVLYSFVTYTNGRNPYSTLAFNSSGDLFGTAQGGFNGVVFTLTPGSGGDWTESVVFQFNSKDGGTSGAGAALAIDSSGNLYGTSQGSGQNDTGAAYRLKPRLKGGATEVLYSFCAQGDCSDGYYPLGGLILDGSDNVYGTTCSGGLGYGVVYEITR
jgi:uncharacterized repeat protein (TIGR03803 family)